jgi:hypothetical protein
MARCKSGDAPREEKSEVDRHQIGQGDRGSRASSCTPANVNEAASKLR